jgi:imidazolonepropionase-like amidohydrolase
MSARVKAAPIDVGVTAMERLAALARERTVWLRVGQLIDGQGNQPLANASVLFDAVQIHEVATDGARPTSEHLAPGQRDPDVDLPDFTLLPCLIEAHAHLFLQGAPVDLEDRKQYLKLPSDALLNQARARWPGILQCGVATVRDAGDKDGVGVALAAEAKTHLGKLATAPWIDSPGAALHHRGRYGAFMGEAIEDHANLAACVAARVRAGAERIKLLVSGIIDFRVGNVTTIPQMPASEVAAIVAAAAQHGRQTFAHASGTAGVENSIEGGVTTIEHGFFVTPEQLARMRDREIAWVPTFAPVQAQIDYADELGWNAEVVGQLQRIIDGHRQMLRLAHAMGVIVLAGSDAGSCGVPHGIGLLNELCHMEQAGLPAMAVLQSATGASAATLAFAEPVGRVAPGCRARFIFTRHDPLETVANLRNDKTVLFDGTTVECNGVVDAVNL